jgi:hypothetical protein
MRPAAHAVQVAMVAGSCINRRRIRIDVRKCRTPSSVIFYLFSYMHDQAWSGTATGEEVGSEFWAEQLRVTWKLIPVSYVPSGPDFRLNSDWTSVLGNL